MASERRERIERVYRAALGREPHRRAEYVAQACGGDRELQDEIELRLERDGSNSDEFMNHLLRDEAFATLTMDLVQAGPATPGNGQLVGHYKILEKIGHGGMGVAYKAIDLRLDRQVALKVIAPAHVTGIEKLRFAREAKATSALNHPNIVTVFEFDSVDGVDFIAMEFVDGQTLSALLAKRETTPAALLDYARQTAVGMARAHAAGIVHRDLKPGNIMVTGDGRVKVLDFGLARREHYGGEAEVALTCLGSVTGTPSYMSPEQASGESVDWRADIFALGIVMYEMFCGKRPFDGRNAQATLMRIVREEPVSPIEVNPAIRPELAALILRCLRKPREDRPQSMEEIAEELGRTANAAAPARTFGRRRFAVGGFAAAAVLAGGVAWLWPRPAGSIPAVAASWAIEAQKMAEGVAVGDPFIASAGTVFEGGWKFRLRIRARRAGFLYVINEGPGDAGTDRYWILYPLKLPDAAAPANEEVVTGWNVFDRNSGMERLWIVYSPSRMGKIDEIVRGGANGQVMSMEMAGEIQMLLADFKGGRRTGDGSGGELVELKHR